LGDKEGLTLHHREALVIFDLDGTLLRGPTVCEVLAQSLGRLERMRYLERFADNEELRAAREEMAGWYLAVGLATLLHSLHDARLAPGAEKGLALLRAHGVEVAIASITWAFAVEYFARRLGVEHWQGTELKESGEIHHIWPEDKARWVRELAIRLRVPLGRTAAVGDSGGDLDMLAAVGVPVFVGRELPSAQQGWLHFPEADIEAVARHLVGVWRLSPNYRIHPPAFGRG
jgi:HAD superfamily phosphoserine phosphatase-like hydrolase